jgi:site-specific DNA-methyltransferase (adenine-specific)
MISLNYRKEGYKFPELKIQTTIIDPPYNIGFNYKSDFKDKMTPEEYNKFIYDCIEGCYHHSIDDANLFLINYPEIIFDLYLAIEHSSWNIHQFIQWVYPNNSGFSKKRFTKSSRTIVWLTKGNPKIYIDRVTQDYKNPEDKRVQELIASGKTGTHLYNWWEINIVKGNSKEHLGYVNQIPYELLRRLILTTTDKDDVVYDPMCGSGSTIYAAGHLGRIGIGYDISPKARDIWNKYNINPYTSLGYKR